MSSNYYIIPINQETATWARSCGVDVPGETWASRMPTFEELEAVAHSFPQWEVKVPDLWKNSRDIYMTRRDVSEGKATSYDHVSMTLIYRDDSETTLSVHGTADPFIVMQIFERLSTKCGPLLSFSEHQPEPPIFIMPGIDCELVAKQL